MTTEPFAKGKFTTESHKLLQGDVGELFLLFLQHVTKSHYYHLSVVADYYIGLYIWTTHTVQ